VVEALGSERHIYFSVDATPADGLEGRQESILAASVPNGVTRIGPRATVRVGTRVTFAVDPARLHFFDPDTGHAIGWSAVSGRVQSGFQSCHRALTGTARRRGPKGRVWVPV
jgi:hypothetical protein